MQIFGQAGGHALQLAHDWDHTRRVDEAIVNLNNMRVGARREQLHYALRQAGLSENDLTEDDIARIMQELG